MSVGAFVFLDLQSSILHPRHFAPHISLIRLEPLAADLRVEKRGQHVEQCLPVGEERRQFRGTGWLEIVGEPRQGRMRQPGILVMHAVKGPMK